MPKLAEAATPDATMLIMAAFRSSSIRRSVAATAAAAALAEPPTPAEARAAPIEAPKSVAAVWQAATAALTMPAATAIAFATSPAAAPKVNTAMTTATTTRTMAAMIDTTLALPAVSSALAVDSANFRITLVASRATSARSFAASDSPEAPALRSVVLSIRTTSNVVLLVTSCPTFRTAPVSAILTDGFAIGGLPSENVPIATRTR
jgi:hypothetical protein